ncbi:MAG: hypothetical protein JWO41_341 [Candidatus Saccharibacteria bacterium]|nr:hypothetical protein [Candidatus Saccharibacteria bacterium]
MIENTASIAQALWLTYHPGVKQHLSGTMRQGRAVLGVTSKALKETAKQAFRESKTRSVGKTALAAFNGAWLNGEDVAWFAGTDALLNTAGSSVIGKTAALATSAAIVATANTALSFNNIRYFNPTGNTESSEDANNESSMRKQSRIGKHSRKFGITMAVGAPINAMQEKFSKKEVVIHNLGYAAIGTGIIGAAYEGISKFSALEVLESPLAVSAIATAVVGARYVNKVCNEAAGTESTAADQQLPNQIYIPLHQLQLIGREHEYRDH